MRLFPGQVSLATGNLKAFVAGLSPAAWFQYGKGITIATGVSQWNDATANARHLKQASGTAQPALQADNSILFDGVAQFLKCDAFTLNQPETVYLLFRQVTWTSGDGIYDGNASTSMRTQQVTASPEIDLNAGVGQVAGNSDLAVNVYGVLVSVFNGASSINQVNLGTAVTGNPGAANAGGFTLGARGDAAQFGNIQVKEVILYAAAHSAATRARVIRYLMRVGGL